MTAPVSGGRPVDAAHDAAQHPAAPQASPSGIRVPAAFLVAIGATVLMAGVLFGWWIGDHQPMRFEPVHRATPDTVVITSWPVPTAPPPGP